MRTILIAAALLAPGLAAAESGTALVKGTAAGSKLSGTVIFKDEKAGLRLTVTLAGVPPGEHGFHIHEFGSCDDLGKAAGSHYNPRNVKHGHIHKDGHKKAHAGDLGNITAGPDGSAVFETVLPKLRLGGLANGVAGRSVIVHEKADDFGQPVGNAGGRIGCGVIVITGI